MHATEILNPIRQQINPVQFIEQIVCSSGSFDLHKARSLVIQLQQEVKEQYGITIDLNLIVNEARKIIAQSKEFSELEIKAAQEFYSQLLQPEIKEFHKYKSGKKKGKHSKKKSKEFFLPNKMAVGFVCILGGSILCVLPFGVTQGIGTGLIGGGIMTILEGARDGEKPYYIESEIGTPTDPRSDSGVGLGVEF